MSDTADILYGCEAIAEFMFGDSRQKRRVYYLYESSAIPIFKLGSGGNSNLCARRAALLEWIEAQEREELARRQSERKVPNG